MKVANLGRAVGLASVVLLGAFGSVIVEEEGNSKAQIPELQ